MITSIQGTLAAATPLAVVIEVQGLGYEVNVPATTLERLPPAGTTVKLHTVAVYREDAQTLYGFASVEERDFFRLLIDRVNGVGPKLALGILSRLSLPLLRAAIESGDVAALARCPGIGRKTAERLVVELKGLLGGGTALPAGGGGIATASPEAPSVVRDAVMALVALGYKIPDADKAVRQAGLALGPAATTEQLLKKALG